MGRLDGQAIRSEPPVALAEVARNPRGSTPIAPRFAHPAEEDLAQLLTFYGVRWSYEPTSFVLEWSDDGRPRESFTPDFFLPQERLYLELTTMRQPLVTRKNRKLRRLKELYPDVRIKLLYRRDYDLLVHSYAARGPVLDEGRPGRVVFSAEQIDERIHTLAGEIGSGLRSRKSRTGEPPLLLAAGRGAATFAGALGEALQMQGAKCEVDQLALSRYRNGGGGRARVRRLPAAALAGRRVLLATELVSTGLSTAFLTRWLHQRGCLAVEHVALLDRKDSRLIELPLSHVAFEAPADLLVGYGLQLRRQYASLPHIALLDSDGDAG